VKQELLGEISQLVSNEKKQEIQAVKGLYSLMGQYFKGQSILITLNDMVKVRPEHGEKKLKKKIRSSMVGALRMRGLKPTEEKKEQTDGLIEGPKRNLNKLATIAPRPVKFDLSNLSSQQEET
jgi:hypothetical protein